MKKSNRTYSSSIFLQAVLIIIVFATAFLALSVYVFRQNMKTVLMNEVVNKATIFLSVMETSIRRSVMGKETQGLSKQFEEQAKFLKNNLNFSIIRAAVLDPQGRIIDHTKPEKIGQTHSGEDFRKAMASGRPLVTRELKVLKQEPATPEIRVIKIIYPVRNRKHDLVAAIKVDLDVEQTFEMIREEYWRFNKQVVFWFIMAAILLLLGTLFFLQRRIIGPVVSVSEASAKVALGDMAPLRVRRGKDEISELILSFNQMVEGLKHRDQMRHALNLAREVQQNLLPKNDPIIDGLDIAGKSIYCEGTGGDYYDYLYRGGHSADKICIVVGDVSDHGIQSALLMATARSALHQRWSLSGSIAHILSDVNRQLVRDIEDSGYFMTLFCTEIDKQKRCIRWVSAGHDPAILYNRFTDTFDELGGRNAPLGIDENVEYKELQRDITKGQIIVIGTDGIWESRNSKGEMFGKDMLKEVIRENAAESAQMILNSVIDKVEQFTYPLKKADDVTLTVIKIEQ
jgi:serine phosphatase RsbU (regulator of sigma subunit)